MHSTHVFGAEFWDLVWKVSSNYFLPLICIVKPRVAWRICEAAKGMSHSHFTNNVSLACGSR